MGMEKTDYIDANRLAWEEVAPRHEQYYFDQLLNSFTARRYSCLCPLKTSLLHTMDLSGKSVGHLCCNNGRELVSLKNLGAGHCTGFDFSDAFINQARQLADAAKVDCEFICTDILKIDNAYNETFDIVLVTVGTLRWMPDLEAFFNLINRILKRGGQVLIHEMHPLLNMFATQKAEAPNQITRIRSYFSDQPQINNTGLDYYSKQEYEASSSYHFHHKVGDIISHCVQSRLVIQHFQEYAKDISWAYGQMERMPNNFPMSFTLIAQKY
jgi:ubiquinone/menaquinone biosynthesis C-methylase UbiE